MAFTLAARCWWWPWALQKAEKSTFWECGKEPRRTPRWSKGCWKICGPRTGSAAAVSGGAGWIESTASRCGTCLRRASGSPALSDPQAPEREGVPAGELPERLRSANAQCLRDEQLRGGQRGATENLPATGKNQSERCPKLGGGAGRNADGTSLGSRSGVAAETGHYQPDRIVLVDRSAGGAKRSAGPPQDCWKQKRSSDASKAIKKSCC